MLEERNHTESFLAEEVSRGERLMRHHCANLPEDRRLDGVSQNDQVPGHPTNLEIYIEQSTGARLASDNAMDVLAHFVSAVPVPRDSSPQYPTYTIITHGTRFQAEVILPGNAPICCATGKIKTKKRLARQSAAFEACMQLRKKAYLNEFFMPIYQKRLPAMRNAALATGLSKGKAYSMRSKPSLWEEARGTVPTNLWVTLVDFVDGQLERPHAKLLLLTRTPLPSFPRFPIYLNNGETVTVLSTSLVLRGPIVASKHLIEKITQFTLVIFNDIFSKEYLEESEKMSYWLCPASQYVTNEGAANLPAESLVNNEILDEVVGSRAGFHWTDTMPTTSLLNKFVVDPWDGGRKFFTTHQICHDLTPNDPVPLDGVQKKGANSVLEFSVSLFKKSRGKVQWNSAQPVVTAVFSPYTTRRNLLAKPGARETSDKKVSKAYICPEPLRISALSPELATTCLMWPAIIHRFESCLISLEGTSLVGVECSPELALMAFTKDSDSSGDHDVTGEPIAVNVRSGMGENYERLEWLGDTFLKVATSISVFIMNPDENEFEFHVRRMLMLCNKNLFRASEQLKLSEFVRSKAFSRRIWYPEGLSLVRGTGVKTGDAPKPMFHDPQTHDLSQKSIADVSEALIGAAFLHARRPGVWTSQQFDNAVQTVTKLVDSEDHKMLRWDDYKETYAKMVPSYQTGFVSAVQKDLVIKLEAEHPYTWRYPRLAQVAFIHPSTPFSYVQLPNYQRLEFLGDALFDLAVVTFLFDRFPDRDPQFLTESKTSIVSNRFLGALCVKLGFHKHLRHNHSELTSSIRDYVALLEEAHAGAELLAPSQPDRLKDYWITVQDPPKCLSDIVESYIGAMFIDSGFQYSVVQDFFDRHVKFFFEDMSLFDSFAGNHPITHMTDILQNQLGCSEFRVLLRDYPGGEDGREKMLAAVLMVHDRIVEGSATTGTSGKYARVRVAKKAAEVFEGLSIVGFRASWGCTCNEKVAK
jgi:endoribonuclease Dicer